MISIVGAGLSGAVIAHQLAKNGIRSTVFEQRSHVAGNCHTERDSDTGILVHKYGPHIFHTNDKNIWDFVNQFDEFYPFINRVKSICRGRVYPMPVNLLTINSFYGSAFSPRDAEIFIQTRADRTIESPLTFEEQALKLMGRELYEAFFKGYTQKQWGLPPSELPASILQRLPFRFNYDDNYYNSKFQGIPVHGYTQIVTRMLDHPLITLKLQCKFKRSEQDNGDHVFYTGPIDEWFNRKYGMLGYRTLDFKEETYFGDFQGNAVINYPDLEVEYTRISEHKHFSPWEHHEQTIIYKEYSRQCGLDDIPYYPIRLINDKNQLKMYQSEAERERNVTFVGRLGTYRYLDMHIAIQEAIDTVDMYLECLKNRHPVPTFLRDRLLK